MDYKTMTIEDIAAWCQEHGELDWLKEIVNQDVERKVYPKKTIEKKIIKDGMETIKLVRVDDTSKEPTLEKHPIPFISVKVAFCTKFMPDLIKRKKKPTMRDFINNL